MRVGVVIDVERLAAVPDLAAAVEDAGLDMLWLCPTLSRPYDAMPAAASCAASTSTVYLGAVTAVTDAHVLYLAEERHVVDQLLGGRLVLGLTGGADVELFEEWVEVLLAAASTTPFAHRGSVFTIPAGLPANSVNPEQRLRVTPAPFSLEPALWLAGGAAAKTAAVFGLSHVVGADAAEASAQWAERERLGGRAVLRLRRPAVRGWDPTIIDAAAFAAALEFERASWGLDTVLVRLPLEAGGRPWLCALRQLAESVRPRLQQDRLPAGLEAFWDEQRSTPPLSDPFIEHELTERR